MTDKYTSAVISVIPTLKLQLVITLFLFNCYSPVTVTEFHSSTELFSGVMQRYRLVRKGEFSALIGTAGDCCAVSWSIFGGTLHYAFLLLKEKCQGI